MSGATVSRVFNNSAFISPETREKVLKAADSLNYHPNLVASNFVKGISGNIGVIIPYIPGVHIFSVYYFSELLSGIGDAFRERGYDLVLFFHKVEEGAENDYLSYFKGGKVDGCILLGTLGSDCGLLRLKDNSLKFCLINNYIKGSGISFADVDNVNGSYEAVKHLIDLGHRKIAFLNGPVTYTNSLDRLTGYKRALEEAGIAENSSYFLEGNYGRKSGYIASQRIADITDRPTAVFASNDRMAAGLIKGLKEKGLNVPGDIAIVGYDDSDAAVLVEPQLTTVRVPFFELGRRCAGEFVRQVRGEYGQGFEIIIMPELIVRASSGNKIM